MEIEAKFAVQDMRTFHKLQTMERIGRFSVSQGTTQTLRDTYLDTPDRRMLAAGYACRVRACGDDTVVTLKGLRSLGTDAAIHRREEVEAHLPQTSSWPAQPDQWPASPVRRRVLTLIQNATLVPLFSLTQHRLTRDVWHGQRKVAELSLDTVGLPNVGQSYYEMEIELKGDGTEADLAAMVAQLKALPGLTAEPRSKFERGLELVDTDPPGAPITNTPGITPDDSMAEAARKTLRFHFLRMLANEPGTRLGKDTEALHDMRVATRRIRTAFRVFADHLDANATAPYRKCLKRTGNALGAVRDLDVFREKAQAYLDAAPSHRRPDLTLLKATWDAEYAHARASMLKSLDGQKYARFKHRFGAFLAAPLDAGDAPRVREAVGGLIDTQVNAFYTCKAKIDAPAAALADYHRLRIAAKHLRYTLEYFREVLGPDGERAISQIKILHNHLGALQDAVVARAHVHNVITYGTWHPSVEKNLRWLTTPIAAPGLTTYLKFQETEIQRLVRTFPEVWVHYQSASFKQLITNAITALSSKPSQTRRDI